MIERQVRVASKVGLHARPAAVFAKAAAAAPVPVRVAANGKPPVSARSLISLLTLGVQHGDLVTLSAEGDGAEPALDDLAALLARELDE
ncbi:HPr family phosphocarrier protein [Pseudonocardia acaciae]|uniref:HPr family phosphocarrier protein n=1 Tax=Pseudonocardia acaciae TaxID=551276 RepID=UPI00048D6013|nr:HPr family phosphocarrier protein [Pseudonocardia acaciae]